MTGEFLRADGLAAGRKPSATAIRKHPRMPHTCPAARIERRMPTHGRGHGTRPGKDSGPSGDGLRPGKDSGPSEPLVPDSYLGPFCRRFLSSFIRECGKDSADRGGPERIPGRAETVCGPERIPGRAKKDSGPSGLGSFGRREFLRWWLLAFGRRALVFRFQRASAADGSGWRAGSPPVLLGGRTSGLFRKGRVERSGGELRLRLRWGLCGAGGGQGGGRSAPCFVDATSQGSDLPYMLVEDRHRDGR